MFKVKQRETGKYYFMLFAMNGYILVTSQDYASKAACYNGIESVRKHSYDAVIEDETE